MSYITHNIPHIECMVLESFLTNFNPESEDKLLPCVVHSCTTIPGQALLFNILLKDGTMFNRLPLSAFMKEYKDGIFPDLEAPLSDWQAWECPSAEATVVVLDLVNGSRIIHQICGSRWVVAQSGTYLFTIDYAGSPEAESAGDFGVKQMHICELDDGMYVAAPNSRLAFIQKAFTDELWVDKAEKPKWRSQTRIWRAER